MHYHCENKTVWGPYYVCNSNSNTVFLLKMSKSVQNLASMDHQKVGMHNRWPFAPDNSSCLSHILPPCMVLSNLISIKPQTYQFIPIIGRSRDVAGNGNFKSIFLYVIFYTWIWFSLHLNNGLSPTYLLIKEYFTWLARGVLLCCSFYFSPFIHRNRPHEHTKNC